jgi:multiple sugar transport system ATP-binding protein
MTVRRNIEFPLRTRHMDGAERAARVEEAASTLGLSELLDRKPAQLSGGQRQRVALARAIVRRPAAFLMDEPLSNLDAKLRVQTRAELVELQRRLETTVLYVTHDQVEAMTMGHRIAILESGVLQQVGPPQEVYDRPANLFVARFIGSPPMNTVTGELFHDDGALFVQLPGAQVELPPEAARAAEAAERGAIVVGVRPEHLSFGGTGIPATVTVLESLGHERHVICRLTDGQMVIVRIAADESAPRVGDEVALGTDVPYLHLFDAQTTVRLGP